MDPTQKFARLAEAHRDDDAEECRRFRSVPLEERARLFAALCRWALSAADERSLEPEPLSPAAESWWRELVRRGRASRHA